MFEFDMQVIAPNSRSGGTGIYHLWVSLGSRQDFMKAFACSYLVVSALPSMTITVLFLSHPVLVAASLTTGRVQLMARSVVLLMLMAGGLFAMGVMLSP